MVEGSDSCWDKTFHKMLPKLRSNYDKTSKEIVEKFSASLRKSVEDISPAMGAALLLMEDIILRSHNRMKTNSKNIFETVHEAKRVGHREVGPEVKRSWEPVYDEYGLAKVLSIFQISGIFILT